MTMAEILFRSLQFSVVATAFIALMLIYPAMRHVIKTRRVLASHETVVEMEVVSFIAFVGLLVAVSLLAFAPRLLDGQVSYLSLSKMSPASSVLAMIIFYVIMVAAAIRARRLRNTLARDPHVRNIALEDRMDRGWFWALLVVIFFTGVALTHIEIASM